MSKREREYIFLPSTSPKYRFRKKTSTQQHLKLYSRHQSKLTLMMAPLPWTSTGHQKLHLLMVAIAIPIVVEESSALAQKRKRDAGFASARPETRNAGARLRHFAKRMRQFNKFEKPKLGHRLMKSLKWEGIASTCGPTTNPCSIMAIVDR